MELQRRHGDSSPSSPPSLKQKIRSSIRFPCCFNSSGAVDRERCWLLGRRRPLAGAFRYDSLSYALNFDEGIKDDDGVRVRVGAAVAGVGFRQRNFLSQLSARDRSLGSESD